MNSNLNMLSNPLAVLYPKNSSRKNTLSFTKPRAWEIINSAQFACRIKSSKCKS